MIVSTESARVYVPDGFSMGPALLFLHGAMERGTDGERPLQVGLGPWLPDHFPAMVVFPQCPPDHIWNEPDMQDRASSALEETVARFPVDRHRVYLTGVSMGGRGSWLLAARRRDLFAALIPICGGYYGDMEDGAWRLKTLPVWAFHGALDDIVPVEESRTMVAALEAVGGNIRYTEYPDEYHESWDRVYQEADLWPWLFSQRLQ